MDGIHTGIGTGKSKVSVAAKQLVKEGRARSPETQQKHWRRNFNFLQDFRMTDGLHFRHQRISRRSEGVRQASSKPSSGSLRIDLAGQTLPRIA
jgi:hypothetical protein